MNGFRYRNAKLEIIHTTSVPQATEEAIAYQELLARWGLRAVYIERREDGQRDWKLVHGTSR